MTLWFLGSGCRRQGSENKAAKPARCKIVVVCTVAIIITATPSWAQVGDGVRFELRLAVNSERPAPNDSAADRIGTWAVTVLVSSHTTESTFSGDIVEKFDKIEYDGRVVKRLIWSDDRCHQDRGLPRMYIRSVSGHIGSGATVKQILAVPRVIGKLVPDDEIYIDVKASAIDALASFNAFRTTKTLFFKTRKSHLKLDLELSRFKCRT